MHKKNTRSTNSNPIFHASKISQDFCTFDNPVPKSSYASQSTAPRARVNLLSSSTPRDDSKPFLFATTNLSSERRLLKLPRDLRSLDSYLLPATERIPPDREDAKQLLKWLDRMLEKTLSEQTEPELIFKSAHKIYNVCLAEVIKQVSANCKERGIIIDRVWRAYEKLFEKATKAQAMKMSLIEEKHINEKNRIHKLYNNQIRDLEETIIIVENKYESVVKELNDKENLCEGFRIREEQTKKRIETIQDRYRNCKKELLLMKEELRVIKIRLQEQADNLRGQPSSLSKLHQRVKIKTKTIIDRELNSDPLLADLNLIIANDEAQLLEHIKSYGNQ